MKAAVDVCAVPDIHLKNVLLLTSQLQTVSVTYDVRRRCFLRWMSEPASTCDRSDTLLLFSFAVSGLCSSYILSTPLRMHCFWLHMRTVRLSDCLTAMTDSNGGVLEQRHISMGSGMQRWQELLDSCLDTKLLFCGD